ncbi:hypothetical protein CRE_20154 [Caenorhabditis remanei]|uniref:Folliculin-interacting protein middle domain-containing protein n=1 Tax=Caenorhabditis remanei TaxID=31234 RepID=E3NUB6_CAERE|nr:hypothetical protein CRE_20154 [Caenorhabditis remanei]
MTSSPSTSSVLAPPLPLSVVSIRTGSGVGIGHRRQHSSPGHLQQYQQELHSRHAANIARIASRRRRNTEDHDPNERPPKDQETILVSKTFAIPKSRKGALPPPAAATVLRNHLLDAAATSSDSDSQSTVKSLDGWRTRTSKSIMTTPEGFNRVRHISITFGEDDSYDSHQNLFGSPGGSSSMSLPRAFSPPHRISKARRRQMAVTTSLSETSAVPIPSSLKARSRMSSMSSSQADDTDGHPMSMQNMRNVALGILVPIQQRCFLMQHIPLIESEMSRLETRIINAAGHPSTFLQNISKSWEELTEIICQLHNAPRLKHPYWLALNEKCHLDGRTLATEFCEQLAYLVRKYDRKEAG